MGQDQYNWTLNGPSDWERETELASLRKRVAELETALAESRKALDEMTAQFIVTFGGVW